jgi:putative lipoprotein
MTALRPIVATWLLLVTSTPSAADAPQPMAQEQKLMVYYCQNLAVLTVRVFPKRVEVTGATRKATLAEMVPPSPVQYSDGTATLSGLDEYVRFEEPGVSYWCRSMPVEVPWQQARLRGIEFRAAGESPDWSLEIDSGVSVEFAIGSGAARVATKFPPVKIEGKDSLTMLTMRSGSHSLAVATEQRNCQIGESTMTLSVTVTFDGKTYSGCGRRLESDAADAR